MVEQAVQDARVNAENNGMYIFDLVVVVKSFCDNCMTLYSYYTTCGCGLVQVQIPLNLICHVTVLCIQYIHIIMYVAIPRGQ